MPNFLHKNFKMQNEYFLEKKISVLRLQQTYCPMVILSEVNQTEKDKYHMISFMCEIYSVNELIHKTEIESQI